jgi:Flp pilus assembly protein TadG
VVEFALFLPLIMLLLLGLWEVGRIAQVSNVMWNGAREAARDVSLGQDTLQTVASNLLTYLQGALPNTFNPSHSTSFISLTITLPANKTGYTCWDKGEHDLEDHPRSSSLSSSKKHRGNRYYDSQT